MQRWLTDLVQDGEILSVLRTRQLDLVRTQLINIANQRGGHDNITVVALEVPQPAHITQPLHVLYLRRRADSARKNKRSAVSWLMLGLLLVAIILLILLLIYIQYR